MKSETVQQAYARALQRAATDGIRVVRAVGNVIYTNSASNRGRLHAVRNDGKRLMCDCDGAKKGYICKHRSVAHQFLVTRAFWSQYRKDVLAGRACY